MKGFKFQPVVWLTSAAVVVASLLEVDRQFHVLPNPVGHWLAWAAAVVALVLTGLKAHNAATPVADPKASTGVPLTPVDGSTDPAVVKP